MYPCFVPGMKYVIVLLLSRRFKKVVQGYMDDFESRGRPLYLLHQTLKHKNPIMIPAGRIKR